jgi:hypothetical protein
MKIIKIILGIVLFLVLASAGFFWYMGIFTAPETDVKSAGPFNMVYEDYTGPYNNVGPVFDQVYQNLKKDGLDTKRGIGVYFDNPQTVAAEKLRSQCGSIIEENQMQKFDSIKSKYKFQILPARNSLILTYHVRSTLSFMFLPMVAYSAMEKEINARNLKPGGVPYELYDMGNNTVQFIIPVE